MAVIGADEVPSVLATGMLVDARAEVRYRGESEPIDPVAGHIPGAVNGPTSSFVDEQGCLLGATEIRSLLEGLAERAGGATRRADLAAGPVAAYCGSGVTASLVVLAAELAGLHPALYAGSWSEWICDTDRPIAVGNEPG
jgi:thiosulfate/3-mercaptopyruvate sulfurtransferase